MSLYQVAQNYILLGALIVFAIMLFACLIRAVKGPLVGDRIVAINMMGTIVIVMIAMLAIMLSEGYLVDISIIYAMMSFLAVIVLSKIYIGIYEEKKYDSHDEEDV
ncbi:MAG: monovalent cation/H+ antiporter complex subunit F [Lachnospiraceae bacterium]|nr:monovalent cation/H+ antiporter complex subunit F [Lachnospiraceae bacterium]